MAVNITWSLTNGGGAMADPLDHGNGGNGDAFTPKTIYLEHDGINQITNCGFYITEKSDVYNGDFSAPNDLTEILGWGNGTGDNFGGFQVNMNATGGFPASSWPTSGNKQPTNGSAFYSSVGDSLTNKIILTTGMGISSPGIIPNGASPNVRFQARVQVPTNEDTIGIREFDQKLGFTFTS